MATHSQKYEKIAKCISLNSPLLVKKYTRSQKLRAEALGWDGWIKEPFETNQSLINNFQYNSGENEKKMESFGATGNNLLSFENENISKHFACRVSENLNETSFLSDNFFLNVPNVSTSVLFESNSPYLSTNKAIFTILLPSSQILVVNSAACQLINYSTDELCSMKLINLIHESHKHKLSSLQKEFQRDSNQIHFNNEKLLELIHRDGESIPVCLYLKKLDNPQKCLAIAEPIDRQVALISVDENGKILSYDEEVALIFQFEPSELVGVNIQSLLPSICLYKSNEVQWQPVIKQKITGRTKSGEVFPVCLTLRSNPSSEIYKISIHVYNGLTGIVLLNEKLHITNFNNYFMKLLFGFSRKEILNQHITNIIPTFSKDANLETVKNDPNGISYFVEESNIKKWYKQIESYQDMYSENSRNDDGLNSLKSSVASLSLNSLSDSYKRFGSFTNLKTDSDCSFKTWCTTDTEDIKTDKPKSTGKPEKRETSFKVIEAIKSDDSQKDINLRASESVLVEEGKFFGFGRHSDGSYINIKYQIKTSTLGEEVCYCVWVTRDLYKFSEGNKKINSSIALGSSFNSISFDESLAKYVLVVKAANIMSVVVYEMSRRVISSSTSHDTQFQKSVCSEQNTRPSTASIISQCDESLTAGEYSQYYTNIRQIGKGAFGYVKMAFKNLDGLLVVTKFIKKKKINIRSWVFHSNLNMKIPLEVSLLTTLQHPNIVKVLDVFHNDSFVQLVMEKHGAGFDLFEFIDRGPKCDEKLKSYIFRQIISAVHYLDSLGILHRDIKDENVIINEKFEVKLIDFGSATFKPADECFSRFYGTMEYCSPEVLQGNTYKGPELEIWALGVTLYVLTFGENPFYNVEETIKGHFSILSPISKELNDLLHKMLDKNVETRITIDKVAEDVWVNQPINIENYKFEEVVRCSEEEAYPPKYVYQIRSGNLPSGGDSKANDSQKLDLNSSNNSSRNLADDIEDFDSDIDLHKTSKLDLVARRKNVSPVLLSSTPLQKKIDKLHRPSVGLRKHLENSPIVKDRSYDCHNTSSVDNDLLVSNRNFLSKKNLADRQDMSKEEIIIPVIDDTNELEFEVRFKRHSFHERKRSTKEESSDSEDRRTTSQESYELKDDNESEEYLMAEGRSSSEGCEPN